ncbi:hypothetical protein BGAL_0313g00150 [Botrytis galanthina]|uniref:Uncharacterized protein n=1 Tax=Botrytis galanthina TaxID=278940 RepID=A0A4S8R0A7_9HELO|nr:hypothetical protein BGAL_0313g00150 [Botrytis galanthina]
MQSSVEARNHDSILGADPNFSRLKGCSYTAASRGSDSEIPLFDERKKLGCFTQRSLKSSFEVSTKLTNITNITVAQTSALVNPGKDSLVTLFAAAIANRNFPNNLPIFQDKLLPKASDMIFKS